MSHEPLTVLVHPEVTEQTRREIIIFIRERTGRDDIVLVDSPPRSVIPESVFELHAPPPLLNTSSVLGNRPPAVQPIRVRCKYQRRLLGLDGPTL